MSTPTPEGEVKEFTHAEIWQHNKDDDCWIVVNGAVVDATKYLEEHPGGPVVITQKAGRDATKVFTEAGHSENAKKILAQHTIGRIKAGSKPLPE